MTESGPPAHSPAPAPAPTPSAIALVGERFTPFLAAGLGLTATAFTAAVDKGEYDDLPAPVHVRIGQGIDENALAEATAAVERRDLRDRLLLCADDLPTPVEPHAVHKRNPCNVLIADFEHVADNEFEAALRIHNDNEMVVDHQSSLHIQGIVLIEAARQMFLAVCELEYMRRWPARDFSYLLTNVSTKFDRPAYPLPAQLRLTAQRADTDNINRIHFTVETQILQGGLMASSTTVECAVFPIERSRPMEERAATALIAQPPSRQRVPSIAS